MDQRIVILGTIPAISDRGIVPSTSSNYTNKLYCQYKGLASIYHPSNAYCTYGKKWGKGQLACPFPTHCILHIQRRKKQKITSEPQITREKSFLYEITTAAKQINQI